MSRRTRLRTYAALAAAAAWALLSAAGSTAWAQTLESVLAPGKVIQGHAKYEEDCRKCHVPFDRPAQDGLCMDCHKEVGQDVRNKTGHHGKMTNPGAQPCRVCHTDHRGRDMRIAEFDHKKFDHALTDYVLRGAHLKVDCLKCHVAGKKWREAPSDCNSCHQKDDVHKGKLGPKCAECHTENNWKETRFDHSKTRFALNGKHADAKCNACHKGPNGEPRYKDTPRTCIACHKADDNKSHKGLYGEKCETCHSDREWKKTIFNHDTDTKYLLRGKHRTTKCDSCHKGYLYKDKTPTACFDCHQKDDKHKGTLGKECGACHTEQSWKEPTKFDHDKTKFPLLGKHAKAECKACHKSTMFKEAPLTCIGCHKKDDKHENTLGDKCGDCHTERDWKATRFDHQRTRFGLFGAHADPKVKCTACHKDQKSYRNTPLDCYSCHKKDDKHEGQLSTRCESCHTDRDWKTTTFDHSRTKFPLTGRHITAKCKDCHETLRYKDVKSDCYSCHKKEDKHKLKFGPKCETCHSTRDWKLWDFDHDKRTDYKLEGKHRKVACEACHQLPAPSGKAAAAVGKACYNCHRADDVHDGSFGTRCERCHGVDDWKRVRNSLSDSSSPDPTIPTAAQLFGFASAMAQRQNVAWQ